LKSPPPSDSVIGGKRKSEHEEEYTDKRIKTEEGFIPVKEELFIPELAKEVIELTTDAPIEEEDPANLENLLFRDMPNKNTTEAGQVVGGASIN
jgi:hypothetical protein